ncbi:MAG: response regulator transcription factor [Castellaniella sp.]|uniref:response regulator transcription factor n=1 Tax=Castellaniella sp. TaxID=1955812 RepID=UPI003A8518BB
MADGSRILIVEDEPTLSENLYGYLERQGMMPDAAYDGHGALALLRQMPFDAVVLDLGLPGLSGLDVLRCMRRESGLWRPVLVLTARERLEDKLLAFDLGAEDYLVKPFSLAEVVARLRVLVRRGQGDASGPLVHGALGYDPSSQTVTLAGLPLALPRKSVLLLEVLLRPAGALATHARLTAALWPDGPPSDRALHDQVHLLRRRLRAARGPDIVAEPGHGWRLAPISSRPGAGENET